MDHIDGAESVARRQNAIEGAGRSAALDVSEHDGAGFKTRALLDFDGRVLPTPPRRACPNSSSPRLRSATGCFANLAPSATTTMLK